MEIIVFYVLFTFSYLLVDCSTTERMKKSNSLVHQKGCPPPVPPLNGNYKEIRSEYIPNDVIKYSCNNGTYRYGPSARICLSNGTWNGTSPYCASAYIRNISNKIGESVLNLTDNNYLTCVVYRSNMNLSFQYNGKSDAVGVMHLVWKAKKEIDIGKFVNVRGTTLKRKTKYTRDSFTFAEYNWSLDENNSYWFSIRMTDAEAKKQPELCEVEIFTKRDDRCPELSVYNGNVRYEPYKLAPTYGSAAVVVCNKGYRISGDKKSGERIHYCSDGGQWTGNNTSCEEVQCEQLGEVKNGKIESKNRNYLGLAKLHCDEGYIPTANKEVTCQPDGKWAAHNFTCNLIDCGALHDVKNGDISYSNTTLYGVATLKCNKGYHIVYEKNSTCLKNASWSYFNFECKQIRCLKFPKSKDSIEWSLEKENLDNATVGTRKTLQCPPGYTKTLGQLYIECLPSGEWSTTNVTCKRANLLSRKVIIIAACVGAVSSAFVFACCLICSVFVRRRLKRRQEADSRLPLNEILERRISSEKHEYSIVVYEEIQDVRKKKPTSPLPKIPSGEDEFNYSLPIDQRKGSCICSGSDIYVVPDDAYKTECSSVQTRTNLKRRNSSADSTYWRGNCEYLGDTSTSDTPRMRKLGSNTSLPDFPANTFSIFENDLYSSD